jgi:hypothetical protein
LRFLKKLDGIKLDESWKNELSRAEINIIERELKNSMVTTHHYNMQDPP